MAVQNQLKDELQQLVRLGVLEKVETPSPWVSSMVVEKKRNGKMRLCIDSKFESQPGAETLSLPTSGVRRCFTSVYESQSVYRC